MRRTVEIILVDGYFEEEFEQICGELCVHSDALLECHLRLLARQRQALRRDLGHLDD